MFELIDIIELDSDVTECTICSNVTTTRECKSCGMDTCAYCTTCEYCD